ncbi:MAG: NUDIX hydrolase N-terminal domain-containing protein [Dehalococcoidales bacterium]|nr:NUDIX hydrolase N-terminal domain-containing protein [Dehalococcoidales bacterium]
MTNDLYGPLYLIADELRAIANYGLLHSENEYERERLSQVLSASARMVGILENRSPDDILAEYEEDMSHTSPLIGTEAAVFRNGRLLLIKRHDDELWAIPGGKTDVGETLKETALRELKEETGLTGEVTRLLGIFDSRKWKSKRKYHIYHFIFEVSASDDPPRETSEALECRFFGPDELPELSTGHDLRVPFLFKLHRGEISTPFMD